MSKPLLVNSDNVIAVKNLAADSVTLTVTSPPYDTLRTYGGHSWDFKALARELYRVTKPGGVVVWIVGDATVDGSETGTSFRQAIFFIKCGFNLHDTMIWNKNNFTAVGALKSRYAPVFEYMFVLSKGTVSTFNPIKDRPNISAGRKTSGTVRQADGSTKSISKIGVEIPSFGQRHNIWVISPEMKRGVSAHPAPFPERLAEDHILSWSNAGDTVLDPFMGSGTTGKMALLNGRDFIGIEIERKYFDAASVRIAAAREKLR